jgi:hypothetical protein
VRSSGLPPSPYRAQTGDCKFPDGSGLSLSHHEPSWLEFMPQLLSPLNLLLLAEPLSNCGAPEYSPFQLPAARVVEFLGFRTGIGSTRGSGPEGRPGPGPG